MTLYSPAAILDAHTAAARAVIAACPLPTPAECDAEMAELDAMDAPACAVCNGDTETLGTLGRREYFKCRACGMVQSR